MQQESQAPIIFVLGAPGSGKGTLCKFLQEEHGYVHISLGDHLRKLSWSTNELPPCSLSRNELKAILERYDLVPSQSVVSILRHKIKAEHANSNTSLLVDGFPRSLEAAEMFDKHRKPSLVLVFECPAEVAKQRFLRRKRQDTDTAEVWDKRYERYNRNRSALENRYKDVMKVVDTNEPMEVSKEKLLVILETSGLFG